MREIADGAQTAGSNKMADMAKDLRLHNVAAVSIWMGGLGTERARAHIAALPATPGRQRSESRHS